MKSAIEGLSGTPQYEVSVTYNGSDTINNGIDVAKTWYITYQQPIGSVSLLAINECTVFEPAEINSNIYSYPRLSSIDYVLGVQSTGTPTIVVSNTQSTLTTHTITGLAGSTKQAVCNDTNA